MEYQVGWMQPDERKVLESWAKLDKVVKDFTFVWTRWKSWEDAPPVVVRTRDSEIVGFHAVKFTKSGYINSAFQFVLVEHRGRRLAGDMVEFLLRHGLGNGATRLRFRCPVGEDGDVFWQGFGMKPFGYVKGEHFYDLTLEDVESISDLTTGLCDSVTADKRTLGHYGKLGVDVIEPAWESVLPMTPLRLVREMAYGNCMTDGEYWGAFVSKSVPEQLKELQANLDEYDFDKLLLEAKLLNQEEALDLVGGEEQSQLTVVNARGVHYLDKFLEDVFNWSG